MSGLSRGQRRRGTTAIAIVIAATSLASCGHDPTPDTADSCNVGNGSGPDTSYADLHHLDICIAASDVSRVYSTSEGKARLDPITLAAFLNHHSGTDGALKNFPGGPDVLQSWNAGFEERLRQHGMSMERYSDPEQKGILTVAGMLISIQQSFNPVLTAVETYTFARRSPEATIDSLSTGRSADTELLASEFQKLLRPLQSTGFKTKDTDLKWETHALPGAQQERVSNLRNPANRHRIFPAFLPYLDSLGQASPSPTPTTKPSPPLPYSTATQLCALGKPVNDRLDPQVIARGIDLRSSEASNGVVQKAICVITAEAARFIFGSSSVTDLHQETYGVALVAKDQTLQMTSGPLGLTLTSASTRATTVPNGSILHTQRATIRVERNLPEDQLSNSQVFNAFGATLEFDR